MPLTIRTDNTDKILKSIQKLIKAEVLVGYPDTEANRTPEPDEKITPSNAQIAYWMEYGEPANNVPARPTLLPGVESVKDNIAAQMRKGGEAALAGSDSGLENSQDATGLIAQSAVKAKITSNVPPPLAQRTIDARKRRNVTRENTLVDTAQMLNAVTYVKRPKGG